MPIDLRSDTFTKPSADMLRRMVNAEVGDDVWGEDPTVNRLEAYAAELFGMDAAVFTCTATQSNQIAIRAHCRPGDEALINSTGHISRYEAGAPAALSGVTLKTIVAPHGKLDIEDVDGLVNPIDQHFPNTRLLCLENTTNAGGGRCYSLEHMQRMSDWALGNNIGRHLDGARLFNAMIAQGYAPADVGRCFDTVNVCFSKGLGCPMGSILIGDADLITKARRARKMFGGALRQAGIVAAAAEYALEHNVERLADDHANAKRLAEGLSQIDGISIDFDAVESNLVFFEVAESLGTADQFAATMKEQGVLVAPFGKHQVRACTHLDVSSDEIETAIQAAATAITQFGHRVA